jgi:hypothetical protein
MRTLVWQRIDEPGMEVARVRSFSDADGVQIGSSYEARWRFEHGRLDVSINGNHRQHFERGDADFCDVFASPFFNSLPVMRDGLLDVGPARDYTMRFVHIPELDVEISHQRYEPLGDRVIRYSSRSFQSDITFGADGFVVDDRGFLKRVG